MALIKCLTGNVDLSNLRIKQCTDPGSLSLTNVTIGNLIVLSAYRSNGWTPSDTTVTGATIISNSSSSLINTGAVLAIAESSNVTFTIGSSLTLTNVACVELELNN